jgi:hypothetical protein
MNEMPALRVSGLDECRKILSNTGMLPSTRRLWA